MIRKEGKYARRLHASLNQLVSGRTKKEWRQDNEEKLKQDKHDYYEKNKKSIQIKSKKYREINADAIKAQSREHYNLNRNKILEKLKRKEKCECGSIVAMGTMSRHLKTKKHKELMTD